MVHRWVLGEIYLTPFPSHLKFHLCFMSISSHDVGLFLIRVGLLNSLGFGISSLLFSISIYQLGSQAVAFGIAYMGCFIYGVWNYTIHWEFYLFLVDLCGQLSVPYMIQELGGGFLFLLWGGNFVIQLSHSFEILCFSVFPGIFFLGCPSSLRSRAFYSYGCRHHICYY